MLSVVRFTIDEAHLPDLLSVGEAMNVVEPGVYEGPRRAGDGFVVDIETSDRWADHAAAVLEFAEVHGESIRDAIRRGAAVTFDVAIDPEDRGAVRYALVLGMPRAFLSELGAAGIGVEVTIYKPDHTGARD
jgi:hypothetical protein